MGYYTYIFCSFLPFLSLKKKKKKKTPTTRDFVGGVARKGKRKEEVLEMIDFAKQ